jgi:hypothetical protein
MLKSPIRVVVEVGTATAVASAGFHMSSTGGSAVKTSVELIVKHSSRSYGVSGEGPFGGSGSVAR